MAKKEKLLTFEGKRALILILVGGLVTLAAHANANLVCLAWIGWLMMIVGALKLFMELA
jgi:hypothetical protein